MDVVLGVPRCQVGQQVKDFVFVQVQAGAPGVPQTHLVPICNRSAIQEGFVVVSQPKCKTILVCFPGKGVIKSG
jgi:hypothetical protein